MNFFNVQPDETRPDSRPVMISCIEEVSQDEFSQLPVKSMNVITKKIKLFGSIREGVEV